MRASENIDNTTTFKHSALTKLLTYQMKSLGGIKISDRITGPTKIDADLSTTLGFHVMSGKEASIRGQAFHAGDLLFYNEQLFRLWSIAVSGCGTVRLIARPLSLVELFSATSSKWSAAGGGALACFAPADVLKVRCWSNPSRTRYIVVLHPPVDIDIK